MKLSVMRLIPPGASLLALAALCACGGGNTTSTPPVVPTLPPSAPTPTPSPYPSANGDSFAYQGTLTQTFTRFATPVLANPDGSTPAPAPTATPWVSTTSTTVAQTVTLKSNASFGTQTGLTELDTQETDNAPRDVTTTIDSKTYLALASNAQRANGIDLAQVALQSSDSNGVAISTTFGAQNGVLDQLPENPGAQWTNAATRTTIETDPSSEQITSTYAADGSYTGGTTFPAGGSAQILEYSDGSGDYTMPLVGGANSEVTISPVQNGQINLTIKEVALGQAFGGAIPVWYPSTPPVLANDTFVDAGIVTLPSACSMPPSFGTKATKITETRVRLDVIFGELEQFTQSSYVIPPYGTVCTVAHDDLQTYYDYSGQTPYAFYFNNTPAQETVTDETLAMQKATLASSSARRAESTGAVTLAAAAPSLANMRLTLAKQHLQIAHHLAAVLGKAK